MSRAFAKIADEVWDLGFGVVAAANGIGLGDPPGSAGRSTLITIDKHMLGAAADIDVGRRSRRDFAVAPVILPRCPGGQLTGEAA
jgi:hypothetical protein